MGTGLNSLLCVSIFAVALPAQGGLVLDACGGGIGKALQFTLANGRMLKSYLFITSLQRASIPLSIVDPRDKRFLRVGLDLAAINLFGRLDFNGKAGFSLPIPNDTRLSGLNLLHQALSFPGQGMVFDRISDVIVAPIAPAGSFKTQARVLLQARSFHTALPLGDGRHARDRRHEDDRDL